MRRIEKPTIKELVETGQVKELTNQDIVENSRHSKEIDTIWLLESGRGTNDNPQALHNYCKSKGETNEFGYGGMQEMICFKTFQESVDRVSQWLDVREAEMYCMYATGSRNTNCSYMDRVNISRTE